MLSVPAIPIMLNARPRCRKNQCGTMIRAASGMMPCPKVRVSANPTNIQSGPAEELSQTTPTANPIAAIAITSRPPHRSCCLPIASNTNALSSVAIA